MAKTDVSGLTRIGAAPALPASPETALLEKVPAGHAGTRYVVRFSAPAFILLCPMTGQPDFAHIVIDHMPRDWLVEKKSLKLLPHSFRSHGAFDEDCSTGYCQAAGRASGSRMARDRRLPGSAQRHPARRLQTDGCTAQGCLAPRSGCSDLSRARLRRAPRREFSRTRP